MFKKILACITVLCTLAALTSCGNKNPYGKNYEIVEGMLAETAELNGVTTGMPYYLYGNSVWGKLEFAEDGTYTVDTTLATVPDSGNWDFTEKGMSIDSYAEAEKMTYVGIYDDGTTLNIGTPEEPIYAINKEAVYTGVGPITYKTNDNSGIMDIIYFPEGHDGVFIWTDLDDSGKYVKDGAGTFYYLGSNTTDTDYGTYILAPADTEITGLMPEVIYLNQENELFKDKITWTATDIPAAEETDAVDNEANVPKDDNAPETETADTDET
jgi:hypothetical protein